MTKNKILDKYKLQIKNVEILDLLIEHPIKPIESIYNYDINIQHKANTKDQILAAILTVHVFSEDKKNRLGKITTSCIFEIKDLQNIIKVPNEKVDFPKDLIEIINSLTISTTRGVMFSQFKGTFLHNAILPLIDPSAFKRDK